MLFHLLLISTEIIKILPYCDEECQKNAIYGYSQNALINRQTPSSKIETISNNSYKNIVRENKGISNYSTPVIGNKGTLYPKKETLSSKGVKNNKVPKYLSTDQNIKKIDNSSQINTSLSSNNHKKKYPMYVSSTTGSINKGNNHKNRKFLTSNSASEINRTSKLPINTASTPIQNNKVRSKLKNFNSTESIPNKKMNNFNSTESISNDRSSLNQQSFNVNNNKGIIKDKNDKQKGVSTISFNKSAQVGDTKGQSSIVNSLPVRTNEPAKSSGLNLENKKLPEVKPLLNQNNLLNRKKIPSKLNVIKEPERIQTSSTKENSQDSKINQKSYKPIINEIQVATNNLPVNTIHNKQEPKVINGITAPIEIMPNPPKIENYRVPTETNSIQPVNNYNTPVSNDTMTNKNQNPTINYLNTQAVVPTIDKKQYDIQNSQYSTSENTSQVYPSTYYKKQTVQKPSQFSYNKVKPPSPHKKHPMYSYPAYSPVFIIQPPDNLSKYLSDTHSSLSSYKDLSTSSKRDLSNKERHRKKQKIHKIRIKSPKNSRPIIFVKNFKNKSDSTQSSDSEWSNTDTTSSFSFSKSDPESENKIPTLFEPPNLSIRKPSKNEPQDINDYIYNGMYKEHVHKIKPEDRPVHLPKNIARILARDFLLDKVFRKHKGKKMLRLDKDGPEPLSESFFVPSRNKGKSRLKMVDLEGIVEKLVEKNNQDKILLKEKLSPEEETKVVYLSDVLTD